jgi:DHA3 family macrolide efflux protein-like MFS transporter
MVSKEQYGRANGMMSLIEAGPGVLSPFLAGALIPIIQIGGILLIDSITFWTAIFALAIGLCAATAAHQRRRAIQRRFLEGSRVWFQIYFCASQPAGLQMVFFFGNLFSGIGFTVLAPMLLARTVRIRHPRFR